VLDQSSRVGLNKTAKRNCPKTKWPKKFPFEEPRVTTRLRERPIVVAELNADIPRKRAKNTPIQAVARHRRPVDGRHELWSAIYLVSGPKCFAASGEILLRARDENSRRPILQACSWKPKNLPVRRRSRGKFSLLRPSKARPFPPRPSARTIRPASPPPVLRATITRILNPGRPPWFPCEKYFLQTANYENVGPSIGLERTDHAPSAGPRWSTSAREMIAKGSETAACSSGRRENDEQAHTAGKNRAEILGPAGFVPMCLRRFRAAVPVASKFDQLPNTNRKFLPRKSARKYATASRCQLHKQPDGQKLLSARSRARCPNAPTH